MNKLVLLMGLTLPIMSTSWAMSAEQAASDIEVVGILGDKNAGHDFDGIVVLKVQDGRTLFLSLNDKIPGHSGAKIVKVENRRVFIGGQGQEPVPLSWQVISLADRAPARKFAPPPTTMAPPPPRPPQLKRRPSADSDLRNKANEHPDDRVKRRYMREQQPPTEDIWVDENGHADRLSGPERSRDRAKDEGDVYDPDPVNTDQMPGRSPRGNDALRKYSE